MSLGILSLRGLGDPSSDQIKQLQTLANTLLVANGYNAITIDGKAGPATCGAVATAIPLDQSGALASQWNASGATCTSVTYPSLVGSKTPVKPAIVSSKPVPISKPPQQTFLGLPLKTVAMIAIGAVALVSLGGDDKKKKG